MAFAECGFSEFDLISLKMILIIIYYCSSDSDNEGDVGGGGRGVVVVVVNERQLRLVTQPVDPRAKLCWFTPLSCNLLVA